MTQERQTARSTRVLILDEDRVEGGMLAFHLRREGLVVMLMTSAEEAADAIAWAEPDVLLVEVSAQGFDGREFLSSLSHLPVDVFAVTDRQLPAEVELDALRLGVIDVMMKPIDPVTLARRLKERPSRTRRGSIAGLPDGGISGELATHSVVHLLQMAHRHRLNARLHAEIGGDWAVLLVRHGEVIDAEAPSATGREAVFQMIRASLGAIVLFPLPAEAEELSRDDVIRADLATLVAEAVGRREPRAVNTVKARTEPAFVLPHVGSPRAPLAGVGVGKRRDEETLEYAAQSPPPARGVGDSARVKRPGEREREQAAGAVAATPPPVAAPARPSVVSEAARPVTNPGIAALSEPPPLPAPPMARPSTGRSPIESPTVDEGFEETTDQQELRRARPITGTGLRRVTSGSGAIVQSSAVSVSMRGAGRRPTDPELGAVGLESDGAVTRATVEVAEPRVDAFETPPRRASRSRVRAPRWTLPTWIMAGVAVVLAIFIMARLATREPAGPPDPGADPNLRLGKALVALDEGRRDEARAALSTLASDEAAASEALAALAKMHHQDGRLLEAQALLERLALRSPRDPEVLAWLGLIQAERRELTQARQTFERALPTASGDLAERLRWLAPPRPATPPPPAPAPAPSPPAPPPTEGAAGP